MEIRKLINEKSIHEKEIYKYFSGNVYYELDAPKYKIPLIVILFTNRSGSNLFAEHLRNTGYFGGLGEAINYPNVISKSKRFNIKTFSEFVEKDVSRFDNKIFYGIKLDVGQLSMLCRWNIIKMFSNVIVFHIIRKDLLNQAISFLIASQTRKWTSSQKEEFSKVKYDFNNISKFMKNTQIKNTAGTLLCRSLNLIYRDYYYEDFSSMPEPYIQDALKVLDIDETPMVKNARLSKQSNEINSEFREMYLNDIKNLI